MVHLGHIQTTNIRFDWCYAVLDASFFNKLIRLQQTIKCNVDLLRIIQLGLTFSDEEGNLHPRSTWQFHFFFDLKKDVFAQDSIELLRKVFCLTSSKSLFDI